MAAVVSSVLLQFAAVDRRLHAPFNETAEPKAEASTFAKWLSVAESEVV